MTDGERLVRLELRQEALVAAINGLTDATQATQDMLAELMKWLQEPPSSALPDLLRSLTGAVTALQTQITQQGQTLAKLPAEVAQAVRAGEGP